MKITEFPSVTALKETNMFLLDGPNGTKIIYAPDLAKELLKLGGTDSIVGNINLHDIFDANPSEITNPNNYLMIGTLKDGEYANKSILLNEVLYYLVDSKSGDYNVKVPLKRVLFRGRNLGSVFTDEQKAAIADGSFKDLFLGDYWSIGGRIWRIVDFDYWYGKGEPIITIHHLAIMSDQNLLSAKMNETDTSSGGFVGTKLYQETIPTALTIVEGAFGSDSILSNNARYTNGLSADGSPSGNILVNAKLIMPNETMIFGSNNMLDVSVNDLRSGIINTEQYQLALFRTKYGPNPSNHYWLRDPINSTMFAIVNSRGFSDWSSANKLQGVRPVFGLIG